MPQLKLEDLLTEEELKEIITLYQNNTSLREIERQTGQNRAVVSRMLERLGYKTTKGNHYRKYFFDFDFFETIDTEKKAYWLGFLYADGTICKQDPRGYGEQEFKLALKRDDREILEKYCEDLKSTYPIREDRHLYYCSFRSQKTVNDLKKLGCVENKSLILTFPTIDQVPKEFIYDFIRGYFDGDGSISNHLGKYQISFVGTEEFIKKLSTYFKGGSVFPDTRKTNSWYFNLGGNLQVIQAYHQMYDNATRFLQRKYNIFQELLHKYDESQGN